MHRTRRCQRHLHPGSELPRGEILRVPGGLFNRHFEFKVQIRDRFGGTSVLGTYKIRHKQRCFRTPNMIGDRSQNLSKMFVELHPSTRAVRACARATTILSTPCADTSTAVRPGGITGRIKRNSTSGMPKQGDI